jgi:murein DD-endopeptidase / murein LD-carboxypeptidase
MKNLIIVSAAVGIFSGTVFKTHAQTAVNTVKFSAATPAKKSVQFIEGIEIKRDAQPTTEPDVWEVPLKKTAPTTVVAKPTPAPAIVTTAPTSVIESCTALQFKFALLMNTEVENIVNIKLYEAVEDWWGTRYRYGGTTKYGVDCSAFTGAAYNAAFGIVLPRTARNQYAACNKVKREDLLEGDLVFFNTRGGVSHVGIYLGNGYFAHSSVHSGVTVSSLNDKYYSSKFIIGGRLPE